MSNKVQEDESQRTNRIEQGFKLPLPTIVEWKDEKGREYKEETVLNYISHTGSSFWLKTPVTMGTNLRLSIALPEKLSDNKNLKLIIKGKVVFIEAEKEEDISKRVTLRFENKYIITEP
ncbi:MAG: PilZ domain-containing protein [Candidatus Aminicenantes bacterium]|nr:PilZ domain-containing protein [Candidatus Aminicenantes bacterium]